MKVFNKFILITVGIACLTSFIQGKVVPFTEDAYIKQADKELVDIAEKAAALAGFNSDYQVIVPKKAGIEINPWNKFTGFGINPYTKDPFIIINPEWFKNIPEDEQFFLLVRNFTNLLYGTTPPLLKYISYIFIFLSIMLMGLIFWLLSLTRFKAYKVWMRVLMALGMVLLLEFIILESLEAKIKFYLSKNYEKHLMELAVDKTQNREAAIKALQYFDSSIKNELKNGETLFASVENLFEEYAQSLKS